MTNVQPQPCKINTPAVKLQTNVSNFIITFSSLPSSARATSFILSSLFGVCPFVTPSPCFRSYFSVHVDPGATNSRPEGPGQSALGKRSGNAWNGTGGKKTQPARLRKAESSKRKLANRECAELGRDENQPPPKRPPAKAPIGVLEKKNSKAAGRKLIAGQGKLTSFFRL